MKEKNGATFLMVAQVFFSWQLVLCLAISIPTLQQDFSVLELAIIN